MNVVRSSRVGKSRPKPFPVYVVRTGLGECGHHHTDVRRARNCAANHRLPSSAVECVRASTYRTMFV